MKIEITKTMATQLIPVVDEIANRMKEEVLSAMISNDIDAIKSTNKNLIEAMELRKQLNDASEGREATKPETVKAEVVMIPERPEFRKTFKSFQSGGMLVPAECGEGMVMVGGYRYELKVEKGKKGTVNVIVRLPDEGRLNTYKKQNVYDDLSMPISLYIVRRGEKGRYSEADRKNAAGIQMDVRKAIGDLTNRQ